ncbi:site-specific integrase [Stappia sp. F7233]|uniref:Site-specific integrase n=1 Tax=Stappia albiluteola TaxID=2758565 RepID=A0A839AI76_9HYPH|nr:site-specific integrase [Stappia albiluteola]MBA5779550.1 site-specific integrase [Stappia albiluteola]
MPRKPKGPRLYLIPDERVWIIRDGSVKRRTGCSEGDRASAEKALADYIVSKHSVSRKNNRAPAEILIADVLNLYAAEVAPKHARPHETAARIEFLLDFFAEKTLAEINGALCRAYADHRPSLSASRRELEDLRAAINHHRREGYCSEIVSIALPEKSLPRERWLTRSEVARMIWAAWRYREIQNLRATDRYTRRHIARFILVALYSGTRSAAVCSAALRPTTGHPWIDLERGVFYRRPEKTRETKKRQPPVPLPSRLLAHLRRWARKNGQTFVVEWNGAPVTSISKAFRAVVTDAKVGDDVTPHTLRHTAATWLMQSGTDLWEASGYLGMTPDTLKSVYGHHHPQHLRGASEGITRRPGQKPDRNNGTKEEDPRDSDSKIIDLSAKIIGL